MSIYTQPPWKAYVHISSNHYIIESYSGLLVADCGLKVNKHARGNAEYIIDVCNNYETLKQENNRLKEVLKEVYRDQLHMNIRDVNKAIRKSLDR